MSAKKVAKKKATKKKAKTVGVREFANILDLSQGAVAKAIHRGTISAKKVDGRWRIDPVKAKKEHEQNRDQIAAVKNPSGRKKPAEVVELPTYKGLTLADAQRQEKVWNARIAQLKYEEQAGELTKADDIKKEAFETGRIVRDSIMQISPRMAHELAAETDPHKVEVMLTKEMNKALAKLTERK